jgi:YbgC/YbaW family acyl-CoA thioester hydrolase
MQTAKMQSEVSVYPFAVQFEDIDLGGVAHHPNYLKFIERARTACMEERGYPFARCIEDGTSLVVAEVLLRYLRPARYGDRLFVVTAVAGFKKSSSKIYQVIVDTPPDVASLASPGGLFKLPGALFHAQLRLVTIDLSTLRPAPMGEKLMAGMGIKQASGGAEEGRTGDVKLEIDWDAIP